MFGWWTRQIGSSELKEEQVEGRRSCWWLYVEALRQRWMERTNEQLSWVLCCICSSTVLSKERGRHSHLLVKMFDWWSKTSHWLFGGKVLTDENQVKSPGSQCRNQKLLLWFRFPCKNSTVGWRRDTSKSSKQHHHAQFDSMVKWS